MSEVSDESSRNTPMSFRTAEPPVSLTSRPSCDTDTEKMFPTEKVFPSK